MNAGTDNLMRLAERDLAAGRWADAEREYARALELDPDLYTALYGRGLARAWRCTPLEGDLAALTADVDEAFQLCRRTGGGEAALRARVAADIINLTSAKYNELTRVYASVAGQENRRAPSPLFFETWSPSRPDGLTLSDLYLPMINHLAAVIRLGEYLDEALRGRDELLRLRLRNADNLARFYDWLIALNATGRVREGYYNETADKRKRLDEQRRRLQKERDRLGRDGASGEVPPKPQPGVAVRADTENKLAHFAARPPQELVCPVCGTVQKSNRTICFQCSCKFVFDDES